MRMVNIQIPIGVGLLTFYVEKVNRKVILIGSYIAVAILSDLRYSFCEPLGSLLYIMIFSTTIILQEP